MILSDQCLRFIKSDLRRTHYHGDRMANKNASVFVTLNRMMKPEQKILYIATDAYDLRTTFIEFRNLLSVLSEESIVRDVGAPWSEIKLSNGSRVRGITARSHAVRGQDADVIVINEVQKVDDKMLRGAIYPALHTYAHTQLFTTISNDGSDAYYNIVGTVKDFDSSILIDDYGHMYD